MASIGRRGRPGLSDAQKAELWQRWKDGQSLSDIGRALSKHAASIHGVVASCGGIGPNPRRRSRLALTLLEREEISRGLASGMGPRRIAGRIGRPPSTVSREVLEMLDPAGYRATEVDRDAWKRARRPERCRLAKHRRLRQIVAAKPALDWSLEQISGWLEQRYWGDDTMQVSHETIYRSLFIQARGVLKRQLLDHLRSRRMMRRSRKATTAGQPRGQIVDAVSIRERPAEIEDRAIPGHWEGDLLSGAGNTHVVERQSRFTMLVRVAGKDTNSVVAALCRFDAYPSSCVNQ